VSTALRRSTLGGLWHNPGWCEAHLRILAGRASPPQIVRLRYNSAQCRLNSILTEELLRGVPVRLMILKARQEGVSTWVESIIYSRLRRMPNLMALILSHDPTGTANLYGMFRRFYENDPGAPRTQHMHQQGLSFETPHNSQVTIQTAAKKFAGTGQTIQMAHLSEVAKWPFPNETMLSLMQAMPRTPGSFAVIESTAYGAGGYFHEQWQAAIAGDSGWQAVFLPWHIHTEYRMDPATVDLEGIGKAERYNLYEGEENDLRAQHGCDDWQLAWRRWCIDNNCGGDVLLFHQEYPTSPEESFLSGGTPRFSLRTLQEWYGSSADPVFVGATPLIIDGRTASLELLPDGGGWLKIWEMPRGGHVYVVGADCAGTDPRGDHNAGCVLDKTEVPWRQVATIHGIRGADLYARALANVGYLYNEALLAIEVNGVGEAVQSHLRHWYPERSIYHRLPIDRAVRLPGDRIGWYTGHITRQNLIEGLDAAIRDQTIAVPDEETVLELINFHRVPGLRNGEAKPGTHDDRVFALGIAIQAAGYKVSGEYGNFDEGRHVKAAAPSALE